MTEDIFVKEITTNFITAAHLTEVKRQYYELDLINEFSGERYVFMIPKDILNMTIMNKHIVKPMVSKVSDRKVKQEQPMMSI